MFALREDGLETEALQSAHYKGVAHVPEDQQAPLWKLRVGGYRCKEALTECKELGAVYKQAKETPGQVTRAEVNGALRDFKAEEHLLFIKRQVLAKFLCHQIACVGNM